MDVSVDIAWGIVIVALLALAMGVGIMYGEERNKRKQNRFMSDH